MNEQTVQLCCAIRMTCRRWLRENGDPRPCVVVCCAEGADLKVPAGHPEAIELEPGATADGAAAAVRSWLVSAGRLPRVATLSGKAAFAVAADRTAAVSTLNALRAGAAVPGATPRAAAGRLRGCVAVVTGSAQGFGRGIAEELIAEGAMMVIADVNDPLGEACAAELEQRFGGGCAIYAHADVSSLASTQAMLQAGVAAFGGIDLFVANAGVLKAGSIEEMDERAFNLVTSVNYTGFFIGVKAASAVMKLQNRLDPSHFMDIIQINSKSGLQGSNRNFAYAGSKFGGIGLTQSFAMELVENNIKVNAVCPGNYFEGPLWSDPETGLFVQYLRAGKVPGARTIEDVKNSYVSKVPMRRGCSPRDVARAILYLYEQEYETGQALPVTGGQVMLG